MELKLHLMSKEIEIWTDGSLQKQETNNTIHMGASATFWHNDVKIDQLLVNIDPFNPSSTKLIGILAAFRKCHYHQVIKLYRKSSDWIYLNI